MILFIKLLLAHLIGDFILQPNSWVIDKESKKHKSIYLYLHTLLHGLLALIFVWKIDFIFYGIILAITHGIIDFVKLNFQNNTTKRNWFAIDQILHLAVILIITIFYDNLVFDISYFNNHFWIILTSIVFLSRPTALIIKNFISIWTPENKNQTDESLENAGYYIGIIERLFVFCFIITNHFEAIGFLLAAKSIFRFGDLKESKDRKLTEYVLIGTLVSFGISILIGLITQHLIK